jgi:hypothetical protein
MIPNAYLQYLALRSVESQHKTSQNIKNKAGTSGCSDEAESPPYIIAALLLLPQKQAG